MKMKFTQFKWLVTMLLLVTVMAMPASTWAKSNITPSKPSGDGSENSPYEISNAAELYWFAGLINGTLEGETQNKSANAELTANIIVNTGVLKSDGTHAEDVSGFETWTPIGKNLKPYTGTFDGQGHTISGLYFNDSSAEYVGLFGYNNGTIKNVGVVDSYFYGKKYVGGVCGYNKSTITGCYNNGTVSGDYDYMFVGGVCGANYGTITGCYNTGSVSGRNKVGGVCGDNDGKITGCYNTGTVSGGSFVGGVCGYNTGTITGCYNTGSVSGSSSVGGVCGENYNTITGCYNIGEVSGNSYFGGVCGSNANTGTITGCYTNSGGVYGNNIGTITDCEKKDDFTDGIVCNLLNTALNNANASVRFCQGANYPIINLPSLVGGVYQISKKEELYAFALLVNNGETPVNAVLTADITVNTGVLKEDGTLNNNGSGFETWTPIGNDQNPFTGTFDGQGHTISGLYFKDSNTDYVGLFGYNKGTIKNVGVVDSYFYGNNYVGGVCGHNEDGTITNCYNTGTVSGSSSYVGGVCGYNARYLSKGTITGCYNTGTISGNQYVGGVCGTNESGTITNCYYLANNDDGNGGKTEEQFKSGEVCYLLNGSSPYGEWGQQIGTNDYPIIGSAYKVLRAAQDGQQGTNYWATFSNRNSNAELKASTGEITVYNATVSGGTLTLTKRSNNKVALGEGVLLKANCEYVNAMNISDEVSAAETGENHLVATQTEATTITADDGYILYRLTYDDASEKTNLGFYLAVADGVKNGSKLKSTPGKAYLKVATAAATSPLIAAPAYSFIFPGDNNTTGIGEIIIEGNNDGNASAKVNDRIYNLQGQQVTTPTKGLYIRNNKKVIIK